MQRFPNPLKHRGCLWTVVCRTHSLTQQACLSLAGHREEAANKAGVALPSPGFHSGGTDLAALHSFTHSTPTEFTSVLSPAPDPRGRARTAVLQDSGIG